MINAVTDALINVHHQIPREILEMAFDLQGGALSIDEAVTHEIIERRILTDLSSIAGQYKEIILDPSWATSSSIREAGRTSHITVPYVVYQVPPEHREHRSIVAVMELSLPFGSSSSLAMMGSVSQSCNYMGVTAGTFAQGAINGVTGGSNLMMPTPILLTGNHVKLTPMEYGMMKSYSLVLKCRLEYDKDFTNLPPDSVRQLSDLVVCATKAYIYNQLVIKLDQGAIMSGQEIGRIREIVDSYSDQQERYAVIREEFHGTAEVMDVETMRQKFLLGIFV